MAARELLSHLREGLAVGALSSAQLRVLQLWLCEHCFMTFPTGRSARRGGSSIAAHQLMCPLNHKRDTASPTGSRQPQAAGAATAAVADTRTATAPMRKPRGGRLFFRDLAALERALHAFLRRFVSTDVDRSPLVASGARTADHVPSTVLRA